MYFIIILLIYQTYVLLNQPIAMVGGYNFTYNHLSDFDGQSASLL